MATLHRLRVPWTGSAVVGPGLSTFYFSGTMTGKPAAVVAFFTAVAGAIAPGVTWTIPSSGDDLDDSTGQLLGAWSASGGGTVVSSGTGVFAAGVGARVVWETGNVHLGRRVKGSTFLVPLSAAQYQADGTIVNATSANLQAAGAALVTATTPDFRIWSRPNALGQFAVSSVTAATSPDQVSTLRSRRT